MPSPYQSLPHLSCSSSVASYKFLSSYCANFRSDPLASVSRLPHSPRALGQVAAQCRSFPPFQYLSSHSLPSCWERRRRRTCDLAASLLLLEHIFFLKKSSALGLYQHPGLLLRSHPGLSESRLMGWLKAPYLSTFPPYCYSQPHPWLSMQAVL